MQGRPQDLAEVLPESQVVSEEDIRSCSNITSTVQQLVERFWEHKGKTFLAFIMTWYHREQCWQPEELGGAPDQVVEMIQSFHQT